MKKIDIFNIPEDVAAIAKTLEDKGFEAYLIGGCVRDILISRKPKDWDITTNARTEEIMAIFEETFYENDYGTVGVVNKNNSDETTKVIEITPYRLESKYSNKRHPDKVEFSKNIEDDLKRRDFTINAIGLKVGESKGQHLYKGELIDPYKGQEDISKGHIVTVGEPEERFAEDSLRIMRAVRLSSELGFMINAGVKSAIEKQAKSLEKISAERIRDEFSRIIMSDHPSRGLILSHELGILKVILPELDSSFGVKQNKAHSFDVGEHLMKTLDHSAKKNWPLTVRLASIFHDIGKPPASRWSDEKKDWTFHGHDVVGAKITAKILARMMFPKKTIDDVVKLVRWHMFFSDTEKITLSSVRRLLKNVGQELIWQLMDLRASDRIGTGRPKESPYRLRKYKSMIEEVMHDPVTVGMLKINGSKIMAITGANPGPKIGHILHILLDEVLENPELNSEKYLEEKAKDLAQKTDKELEELGKKGKEHKMEIEEKALTKIRDKYWVK